jgi:hypothetical protein
VQNQHQKGREEREEERGEGRGERGGQGKGEREEGEGIRKRGEDSRGSSRGNPPLVDSWNITGSKNGPPFQAKKSQVLSTILEI